LAYAITFSESDMTSIGYGELETKSGIVGTWPIPMRRRPLQGHPRSHDPLPASARHAGGGLFDAFERMPVVLARG
jgi:hypothetical protein